MKNRQLYLVVIGVLLLGGAVWADDDNDQGRGRGPGDSQAYGRALEFRLVQAEAFNPVITPGTIVRDQLVAGANNHLTVQHDRTAQVEFRPAPLPVGTNPVYRVWLCRNGAMALVSEGAGCVVLLNPDSAASAPAIAELKPDSTGVVRGTAVFPPRTADVWVGSFVVTRDTVAGPQFVSAIDFETPPNGAPGGNVSGPEAEVHGEIESLGDQSFGLAGMQLSVRVDASTRFEGRPNSIRDLKVGMTVDVRGVMQTDSKGTSFLLAERVRAEHEK